LVQHDCKDVSNSNCCEIDSNCKDVLDSNLELQENTRFAFSVVIGTKDVQDEDSF
jgi:hypothetical protein